MKQKLQNTAAVSLHVCTHVYKLCNSLPNTHVATGYGYFVTRPDEAPGACFGYPLGECTAVHCEASVSE